MNKLRIPLLGFAVLMNVGGPATAQSPRTDGIVFAVLNEGKSIEPVAKVVNGKLEHAVSGDDDNDVILAFHKAYYGANATYHLVFAGADAGTVTVTKAEPKEECDKAMAMVTTNTTKAKLSGVVMGLATDIVPRKAGSGLRRKATAAEHAEIETLVAAEFAKNHAGGRAIHFQNLTVFDVDNDGSPEFVGSSWVELSATERGLMFFIASQLKGGTVTLGYSEFRRLKQDEVMNGDIKTVDNIGILQELVLDVLDVDGDGTAEVFTVAEGFEGASFAVYSLKGGKWARVFEGGDYRCAF